MSGFCTYCAAPTAETPASGCRFPTVHKKGTAAAFERAAGARRERMTHEDWRYWTGVSR